MTIQAGVGNIDGQTPNFTSNVINSTIDVALINAALDADTGVTIFTGAGGAQAGDLTVAAPILKSAGAFASLNLDAHGDLNINATITATSGGIDLFIDSDTQSFLNQDINLGTGNLAIQTGAATISPGVTIDADGLYIANTVGQTASLIIDNATVNLSFGGQRHRR